MVNMNNRAKYPGQRSFPFDGYRADTTQTHAHNGPTALRGPLKWSAMITKRQRSVPRCPLRFAQTITRVSSVADVLRVAAIRHDEVTSGRRLGLRGNGATCSQRAGLGVRSGFQRRTSMVSELRRLTFHGERTATRSDGEVRREQTMTTWQASCA